MDNGVADNDVVGVVEEAARGAPRDVEALDDVVVAPELQRRRPPGNHGAAAPRAEPDNRDLRPRRARLAEHDAPRVGHAAVDLDAIPRPEEARDGLQIRVRPAGADRVGRGRRRGRRERPDEKEDDAGDDGAPFPPRHAGSLVLARPSYKRA